MADRADGVAMRTFFFLMGTLLFCSHLASVELAPWFGKDKLIEITPFSNFGYYPRVDSDGSRRGFETYLYQPGVSVAFSPSPEWSIEAESSAAVTNRQGFAMEDYALTGRYLFWNDVVGDPVSLAVGATVRRVTHPGRRNLATYYHGEMEYLMHVAMGKEWSCREFWTWRTWGSWAAGIANRGSAWMYSQLYVEKNFCNCAQAGLFLKGYFGGGNDELLLTTPFHGYANIRYRAIDWGGYFEKEFEWGRLSIAYTHRPWGHNFPTAAHFLTVALTIPYNL